MFPAGQPPPAQGRSAAHLCSTPLTAVSTRICNSFLHLYAVWPIAPPLPVPQMKAQWGLEPPQSYQATGQRLTRARSLMSSCQAAFVLLCGTVRGHQPHPQEGDPLYLCTGWVDSQHCGHPGPMCSKAGVPLHGAEERSLSRAQSHLPDLRTEA